MATFHISFDTLDMPGRIVAVRVDLTKEVIRNDKRKMRVDLCAHPLYRALESYVLANPSREREAS